MAEPASKLEPAPARLVTYDAHPDRYRHWKLSFDGAVATLAMDVNEDGGLVLEGLVSAAAAAAASGTWSE